MKNIKTYEGFFDQLFGKNKEAKKTVGVIPPAYKPTKKPVVKKDDGSLSSNKSDSTARKNAVFAITTDPSEITKSNKKKYKVYLLVSDGVKVYDCGELLKSDDELISYLKLNKLKEVKPNFNVRKLNTIELNLIKDELYKNINHEMNVKDQLELDLNVTIVLNPIKSNLEVKKTKASK